MRCCSFLLFIFALTLSAQTASFPTSAVGDSQLKVASNGLPGLPVSYLTAGMGTTDTAINVVSGTLFPTNTIITIDAEKISICGKSGNTLTVGVAGSCPSATGRGFDGTTASVHALGGSLWMYIDAWYHNASRVEIEAVETYLLSRLNYKQTITNATSPVTINASTHLQGTLPTLQCWVGASSPYTLSACPISMDDSGNITLNASTTSPFTGFVIISAGH